MRAAVLRLEPARGALVPLVEFAEPALERALLDLGHALEPPQGEQPPCVLVEQDVEVMLDAAVVDHVVFLRLGGWRLTAVTITG